MTTVKDVVDKFIEKQKEPKYDYEWIHAIVTNGPASATTDTFYNVNDVVETTLYFEFTEDDGNRLHRRKIEGRIIDRSSIVEE